MAGDALRTAAARVHPTPARFTDARFAEARADARFNGARFVGVCLARTVRRAFGFARLVDARRAFGFARLVVARRAFDLRIDVRRLARRVGCRAVLRLAMESTIPEDFLWGQHQIAEVCTAELSAVACDPPGRLLPARQRKLTVTTFSA